MKDAADLVELFETHGIPLSSYVDAAETSETVEVEPEQLYDVLDEAGFSLFEGDTAGRLDCGESLNLLAVNMAMLLADVQYAPDVFTGLLYSRDDYETTVVVFDDGQLATVDAPDEERAREALLSACEILRDLNLVDVDPDDAPLEVPAESVPVRV